MPKNGRRGQGRPATPILRLLLLLHCTACDSTHRFSVEREVLNPIYIMTNVTNTDILRMIYFTNEKRSVSQFDYEGGAQ
jgi:hypothetical protein